MKNLPDGINRLEIAEEKVDECEATEIETIQNKTQGEKMFTEMKRVSMSHRKTSCWMV